MKKQGWSVEGVVGAVGLALAIAGTGEPAPRQVLPALELSAIHEGVAAPLPSAPAWALVYVKPDAAGQRLLGVLERVAAGRPNVAVVVAGPPAAAAELAERFAKLDSARWYADPARTTFERLELAGSPAVLGIRAGVIEWRLDGAPADEKKLRSLLQSWVVR